MDVLLSEFYQTELFRTLHHNFALSFRNAKEFLLVQKICCKSLMIACYLYEIRKLSPKTRRGYSSWISVVGMSEILVQ